jgi:hypothetical protein
MARLALCVKLSLPSPLPTTVMEMDPVFGSLALVIIITRLESKVTLCVVDPDFCPTVEMSLKVELVDPEALHRTSVVLAHSVASLAVAEKRAPTELS